MDLIVTAPNVRSMLKRRPLIVDARSYAEYAEGHIPGAVNIDLMQFHWIDTSKKGISDFNRQSLLLLSNIGVRQEKPVVFYDNVSGSSASRGVWLVRYFSHTSVAMLDGGIQEWKRLRYPLETKSNAFKHSDFDGEPDKSVLADFGVVKTAIGKQDHVLLDVRSQQEFAGTVARAAHAGHMPGARNIDWTKNLKKGLFKPDSDLGRLYADIPKDSKVVTYCQGGYRAANTFVVLKHLGYKDVKMYLGSWGEWGNRPDLPFVSEP